MSPLAGIRCKGAEGPLISYAAYIVIPLCSRPVTVLTGPAHYLTFLFRYPAFLHSSVNLSTLQNSESGTAEIFGASQAVGTLPLSAAERGRCSSGTT